MTIKKDHHIIPVHYQRWFVPKEEKPFLLKKNIVKKQQPLDSYNPRNHFFLYEGFSIKGIPGYPEDYIENNVWDIDTPGYRLVEKYRARNELNTDFFSRAEKEDFYKYISSYAIRNAYSENSSLVHESIVNRVKEILIDYKMEDLIPSYEKIFNDKENKNAWVESLISVMKSVNESDVLSRKHWSILKVSDHGELISGDHIFLAIKEGQLNSFKVLGVNSDVLIMPLDKEHVLFLSEVSLNLSVFNNKNFVNILNTCNFLYSNDCTFGREVILKEFKDIFFDQNPKSGFYKINKNLINYKKKVFSSRLMKYVRKAQYKIEPFRTNAFSFISKKESKDLSELHLELQTYNSNYRDPIIKSALERLDTDQMSVFSFHLGLALDGSIGLKQIKKGFSYKTAEIFLKNTYLHGISLTGEREDFTFEYLYKKKLCLKGFKKWVFVVKLKNDRPLYDKIAFLYFGTNKSLYFQIDQYAFGEVMYQISKYKENKLSTKQNTVLPRDLCLPLIKVLGY